MKHIHDVGTVKPVRHSLKFTCGQLKQAFHAKRTIPIVVQGTPYALRFALPPKVWQNRDNLS
eukprot:4204632-Amphidinium_carterae.1